MGYGIKITPADKLFSRIIRTRDKMCMRCRSKVEFRGDVPISHQASHFYTRRKWSTRFDLDNVDTLCFACHHLWGGDDREKYKEFKIKQLGQKGFDSLTIRSNTPGASRDEALHLLFVKGLAKELGYEHLLSTK